MGVTSIPSALSCEPADSRAVNLLVQFLHEAKEERDPATEHNLRNLTGVRPYKP